ncbi:50S ribosomal protein L3 [Patescibacteria group bacterium]|nr:MAG: 50S ribosomal protein L3 [Patescibacteria group bacterium]
MAKFILGKKLAMTQIFLDSGVVVPVTRVAAGPCQITRVIEADGRKLVELGNVKQFIAGQADAMKKGDRILADTFSVGDKVTVVGQSKGKGFAGVVKRHHFAGGPASHGHKDNLRAPGSIGAGGVQRVFKGMRMAGRMGGSRVTVKNLEIMGVDLERSELLIKGAVPGGRNALLMIEGEGELKVTKKEVEKEVETAAS